MREELITPARATELLALNHHNRNVSEAFVVKYASDMTNGRWRNVGDPIRYNSERLYDGQHRLLAIVRSGCSQCMWVKDDTTDEDMKVIDTGKPRRLADTLRWNNVSNARDVAALVKMLAVLFDAKSLSDNTAQTKLSQAHLLKFYEDNSELVQAAVRRALIAYGELGISKAQLGAAFGWLDSCQVDPEMLEAFCGLVSGDGSNLEPGSPILALRNYANRAVRNRRNVRRDELFIAVLKTYNAWIDGKHLKHLKVLPSEEMPVVVVL